MGLKKLKLRENKYFLNYLFFCCPRTSCFPQLKIAILHTLLILTPLAYAASDKPRARDFGIEFGILPPGPNNAITDVTAVRVGHFTLQKGKTLNTGITAILPHGNNLYLEKVPAAIYTENGFGKLIGSTQINELGQIETPILLTGTLSVPRVADGLISYMLALPGMEAVHSINPLVGETNDGYLSDIRQRPFKPGHVRIAIKNAQAGPVELGNIGAGAGTVCFGFKGGIGSASRQLPEALGGWIVGVLVQTNFGGILTLNGINLGKALDHYPFQHALKAQHDGSLMIVIATDAPLDHRNLQRLAKRSFLGMARTGGYASNGSGDYAIAFSTHSALRIRQNAETPIQQRPLLENEAMSPLFLAVVEATEEAIIDSLFAAESVNGFRGNVSALPIFEILELLKLSNTSKPPDDIEASQKQ